MSAPGRMIGAIAAVVSILGFFGVTHWTDLVGADEPAAEDGSSGNDGSGGGGAPPTSVLDVVVDEPNGPIDFTVALDLFDGASEIRTVVYVTNGPQVELYASETQPHDEQRIELPCDCRLEYDLETWAWTVEAGELYGSGGGHLDVTDGDVARVVTVDTTSGAWVVGLRE